jgi:hypothetical protein
MNKMDVVLQFITGWERVTKKKKKKKTRKKFEKETKERQSLKKGRQLQLG